MNCAFKDFSILLQKIKDNIHNDVTVRDFINKFDKSMYDFKCYCDLNKYRECENSDSSSLIKKMIITDVSNSCVVELNLIEMNLSIDQMVEKILSVTVGIDMLKNLSKNIRIQREYVLCSDTKKYYCLKELKNAKEDSKATEFEIFEKEIIKEIFSNKSFSLYVNCIKIVEVSKLDQLLKMLTEKKSNS